MPSSSRARMTRTAISPRLATRTLENTARQDIRRGPAPRQPPGFALVGATRSLPRVATFDDVARLALALPGTDERVSRGNRQWRVGDKLFVWERPLRKSDLAALGDAAPSGPILGARVEHEGAKQALVQDPSGLDFTTPHFDGYPAILVRLDPMGL